MMNSFADLLKVARAKGPQTIAVAQAADVDVLQAIAMAEREGLVRAVLTGDAARIRELAPQAGLDLGAHTVVHAGTHEDAAEAAVRAVSEGRARFLMKGMLQTAVLLKAVLNKEWGLRAGNLLSHVALFEVPDYDRLLLITDVAMLVAPDLKQKAGMIKNAVRVMHNLGFPEPQVAVLAAVETVNPDMPATLDAAELKQQGAAGAFGRCQVDGPLAMDLALSVEAAHHKKVGGPVAGHANVLVTPDIEAGNIVYKGLVYLAKAKVAGVIVGAKAPVVLISRADTPENKLYSIALGLLAD